MKADLKSVEGKLKAFFQQFTRNEVNDNTSINNDLKLLASEISLIIVFFKKEFEIELTEKELQPYFLDEFSIPFQYTFYKIFKPSKLDKHPLTIGHLVLVCQKGFWFPPS